MNKWRRLHRRAKERRWAFALRRAAAFNAAMAAGAAASAAAHIKVIAESEIPDKPAMVAQAIVSSMKLIDKVLTHFKPVIC